MKISSTTLLFCILIAVSGRCFAQDYRMTVSIAGDSVTGFSGDGGSCKAARIYGPKDICVDAAQNLYFTDQANGRIRKISAHRGIISTVAGGGTSSADGIPATNAAFTPKYICIDAGGNLYFTSDNEVKKVTAATGIITTIAGSATAGYGGDGGQASAATLNAPQGICVDGTGNLFIADRLNNRIRKIDVGTGLIKTIAGTGTPGYSGDSALATAARLDSPACVAVNAAGDVFFSDQEPGFPGLYNNSRIRKITAGSGLIYTIAGSNGTGSVYNGAATLATLGPITGLYVDKVTGNLFCNEMSCSCRYINMTNDSLYLVGGNFYYEGYSDDTDSRRANMDHPFGLCVDNSGTVYIADSVNNRIRKILPLSTKPKFVYGKELTIEPVCGVPFDISRQLACADMDFWEIETWSIITHPTHGIISGLVTSRTSFGYDRITPAAGVFYTQTTSRPTPDYFKIQVSNSYGADTLKIYVTDEEDKTNVPLESTQETAIRIYPNPATTVLNIERSELQYGKANIIIEDVLGRICYSSELPETTMGSKTTPVDISALPRGIYLVKVNASDVARFVKE